MLQKALTLCAVAGLLAFAFAGPPPDSVIRVKKLGGVHRDRDSVRMFQHRDRGAVLPSGIDANKVIRQVHSGPKPEPPRQLGSIPFGAEKMSAPSSDYGGQYRPAVAFDGTNYLVVWEDESGDAQDIRGALVDANGDPVDPNKNSFIISSNTDSSWEYVPSVAFDGTNFLVVWEDWRDTLTWMGDIYGARVSQSGAVVTGDENGILISENSATTDQYAPAVAFDGTNYLVVWEDWRHGYSNGDIYGARVSKSGSVLNDTGIAISKSSGNQYSPSVTFGGTNYLVVWEDQRNGVNPTFYPDIYGARVDPQSGAVVDGDQNGRAISNEAHGQYTPTAAFDGTDWLVVWCDQRSGADIYGARVNEAGSVVSGDENGFEISLESGQTDHDQLSPSVAFDGTEYLVLWSDTRNSHYYDIYGSEVSLARVVGTPYQISSRTSENPFAACGPVEGKAMAAYQSFTGYPYGYNRIWARAADLPLTGDVATLSIVGPAGSFLLPSDPIPSAARLVNNGSETRSFKVKFTMTPPLTGYPITKTVLGLRPGFDNRRIIEFAPFTLTTGAFTAKCSTMLAGELTTDRGNDWKTAVFQGCTFIDFFDYGDFNFVASDGNWSHGAPTRPPWTLPPMDNLYVWGNGRSGTYGANENSTLTSPSYTASLADPAIAFQHSFIIDDADDGGSFEYRIGTGSWTWKAPSAGEPYTGSHNYWTGSSKGWKQSVFVLDDVDEDDEFQVRWRFTSNAAGNDHGWLLDEVAGINCDLTPVTEGHGSMIDTLNVYPVVVRGGAQVNYTLKKDCNVTINLYDASGRIAARVPTSGFKKGKNTARLDASGLARGVYFVKVKGETDTKTTKVIIE